MSGYWGIWEGLSYEAEHNKFAEYTELKQGI